MCSKGRKSNQGSLDDRAFLRYQRQLALPDFAEQDQLRLQQAKVLIVGCGGLGCNVAQHLAAAGVGVLVVADGDVVELSNLHRQVAYREADIGSNKALALTGQLSQLNGDVRLRAVTHYLDSRRLELEVMMADLVIDCTDNFPSRYRINKACIDAGTALISGAVIGWSGYVVGLNLSATSGACYNCLFPSDSLSHSGESCTSQGVAGPIVGVIGAMLALQSVKWLVKHKDAPALNKLYRLDGLEMHWSELTTQSWAECPVCNSDRTNKMDGNEERQG